jgi:hypothetical protein
LDVKLDHSNSTIEHRLQSRCEAFAAAAQVPMQFFIAYGSDVS